MRKIILAVVFSAGASASFASNVVDATGSVDTNVVAINTSGSGDQIGLAATALTTYGPYGYHGTAITAEGLHTGVDIKAGPGTGYQVRGVNISAIGGEEVNDVWGLQAYTSGVSWSIGADVVAEGGSPIGYRAFVDAQNDAVGFQTTNVVSSNGNAYGLQFYGYTSTANGSAYGAQLGDIVGYNGSGYGVHANSVSGDYGSFGFDADYVTSSGGDAYGLRLSSVNGYYGAYGVYANAYGNYGGASAVWANGSTTYNNGYGVYAQGYSENQDGIGLYAYGSSHYGTGYAGVFDGDVYVSSSVCSPCSPSDQMFKKNVQPLGNGLNTIMALKPKTYEMKADEFKDRIQLSKGKQRGFLAQDLEAVIPEMVHPVTWPARMTAEEQKKGVKKEGLKFKAVNYSELIPVLVQAVQEQQAMITSLEAKVARLEAR